MSPDREEIRERLLNHLKYLSVTIGDRSVLRPLSLRAAEDYLFKQFTQVGWAPQRQSFEYLGLEVSNIIAGDESPDGYFILGAHYDTVAGTPGADDNASAVAVLLEVARLTKGLALPKPWAFIGFTTEEPPAHGGQHMGSRVYAKMAKEQKRRILGMVCLEMVGYFSKEEGSQKLPQLPPGVEGPSVGDFICVVGNDESTSLMQSVEVSIREGCSLPVFAAPLGITLSDHASFWDEGYEAVMVTDTAFMRNPHYHSLGDVLENLDLGAMTELTLGLVNFLTLGSRNSSPQGTIA